MDKPTTTWAIATLLTLAACAGTGCYSPDGAYVAGTQANLEEDVNAEDDDGLVTADQAADTATVAEGLTAEPPPTDGDADILGMSPDLLASLLVETDGSAWIPDNFEPDESCETGELDPLLKVITTSISDAPDGSTEVSAPEPSASPDSTMSIDGGGEFFVLQQGRTERCLADSSSVPPLTFVWPQLSYCDLNGDLICNTGNLCSYTYTVPRTCAGGRDRCPPVNDQLVRFRQRLSFAGSPIGDNLAARLAACNLVAGAGGPGGPAICAARFGVPMGSELCRTARPRVTAACTN